MTYVVPFTSVTHSAFIPHRQYAFGMILWLADQKQDQRRYGGGSPCRNNPDGLVTKWKSLTIFKITVIEKKSPVYMANMRHAAGRKNEL